MRLPPPVKPGPGSTAPREPAFMSGGPKPKKPIKPVKPGKPTSIRLGTMGDGVGRPKGMAKGGAAKKGMAYGGMTKKGKK